MTELDSYAGVRLDPDAGERLDAELVSTDDALVKAFALGPGAEIPAHDHPESTNVFHVVEGEVVVVRDGTEERIAAPGVVANERGATHGARNESDERAVLTATLAPHP